MKYLGRFPFSGIKYKQNLDKNGDYITDKAVNYSPAAGEESIFHNLILAAQN